MDRSGEGEADQAQDHSGANQSTCQHSVHYPGLKGRHFEGMEEWLVNALQEALLFFALPCPGGRLSQLVPADSGDVPAVTHHSRCTQGKGNFDR